jgi:hypothetical protein
VHKPGLPDFSWCMIPKPEKMYQINTKCSKWSKNIPNVHKGLLMSIKYINIFQSEALEYFPNWDFWLKTNHLAALAHTTAVFLFQLSCW